MDLAQLSERIFRDGVGVSRSYALGTSRYQQLAQESSGHLYHDAAQVAEIRYLGECLADRAFRNLPISMRRAAVAWPEMTAPDHEVLLRAMVAGLKSSMWRRRAPTISTLKGAESLPAQTGSWRRGSVRPNCLGLSQMLVGFARATGARHLLVNVIQPDSLTRERLMYRGMHEVAAGLVKLPQSHMVQRERRRLESFQAAVLTTLDAIDKTQAHHALAIESYGRWWLVDPYLGVMYRLRKDFAEQAYRRGSREPGEVLTVAAASNAALVREWNIACDMGYFALAVYGLKKPPVSELIDIAWWAAVYAVSNTCLSRAEAKKLFGAKPQRIQSVLQEHRRWSETERRAGEYQNFIVSPERDGGETSRAAQDRALAKLESSSQVQREALERFLQYPLNLLAWWFLDYETKTSWHVHPCIELAEASHGLATATLNHIAHVARLRVPALVELSSAQTVLRDNMGIVERYGSSAQQAAFAMRLERKLDMHASLLHPHLYLRKEVKYGKMEAQDTE